MQAKVERMKQILKEAGISMSVNGCGCCGSPVVTFTYKGEQILDHEDDCSFGTDWNTPEENHGKSK